MDALFPLRDRLAAHICAASLFLPVASIFRTVLLSNYTNVILPFQQLLPRSACADLLPML
ncbi:hypothetical protein SUBVAR_05261 [Subdoligranulum variabile DSM 15176]|uniref:Uncharacterized protein n=1 Tax=Subdoligranulum variabile DSM 15176 TaxID=411471 RepID=D1PLP4_9FIRM|nr:hypothetical protein SUBVAR_05261 [Subdoligranulum variabile DSM 15176]